MKIGGTYEIRREIDGRTLRYTIVSFDVERLTFTIHIHGDKQNTVMGAGSRMANESVEVAQ